MPFPKGFPSLDTRNRYIMAEDNRTGVLSSDWSDEHLSVTNFATFPITANSLYCVQLTSNATWRDWTAPGGATYGEWYGFFKFRFSALPGAQTNFFNFQTSAAATQLQLNLTTGGAINMQHGSTSVTTAGTMAANTIYNVWVHYKAGSGANGVGSVAFSTTENEPLLGPNFVSTTAGTSTANVAIFDPENTNTGGGFNFFYGKFRLSTKPIGSNPP